MRFSGVKTPLSSMIISQVGIGNPTILIYWVRDAEGADRGERYWRTVFGRSAGSSKLLAYKAQVI